MGTNTSRERVEAMMRDGGPAPPGVTRALLDERDDLAKKFVDATAVEGHLAKKLEAIERQRGELREALVEIAVEDWPALISRAKAWGVLPDRHGADRPEEYDWKGDHHDDARYVYPARQRLVGAVANAAAARARSHTDREADNGVTLRSLLAGAMGWFAYETKTIDEIANYLAIHEAVWEGREPPGVGWCAGCDCQHCTERQLAFHQEQGYG